MENSQCASGTESQADTSQKAVEELDSLYECHLARAENCLQKQTAILRKWVDDLSDQNRLLRHTVYAIEKKALQKICEVERLKKKHGSHTNSSKQLECLQKRLAEMEEMVNTLNETVREKDDQLARVAVEADEIRCSREQVCAQKQELISENCSLNNRIDELTQEMERGKITVNELTNALKQREEENATLSANEAIAFTSIQQLENDLACTRSQLDKKNEQLKQYARDVTSLRCQLAEQKKICAGVGQDLKDTTSALKWGKEQLFDGRCSPKAPSAPSRCGRNTSLPAQLNNSCPPNSETCPHCGLKDRGESYVAEIVDLRKKLETQRDLQIALASEVAEKHDAIINLKEQILDLDNKLRQTEIQAHFKDDIIRELRKEVKLGRAKESLAEMLGLKEGPRVQMKSRIDRLSSELDEKRGEIARLNHLIDNSSLVNLENQVKTLALDLESRDKKMLAMCDKIDYIRSYLNQLKCEEQLSIKCGLEALLTELNDDVERNREMRRNVSISLDREPNDGVIIINHRSHSLPDSALQRQVQNFKETKFNPQTYLHGGPQSVKFATEDFSRLNRLKTRLECSQMNLSDGWNNIRKFNTEEHRKCLQELDSIIESMKTDHVCLLSCCSLFENVGARLFEVHDKTVPNEFMFTTIQNCLKDVLEKFNVHFDCDLINEDLLKMKATIYQNMESNINTALIRLENVKTQSSMERELVHSIDLNKLQLHQQKLATITQNKIRHIKLLVTVKTVEDTFLDKLSEFESNFLQHQSTTNLVKSELEMVAEQIAREKQLALESSVTASTSTEDLPFYNPIQKSFESGQSLENVLKKVDSSKLLEIMDHDVQMSELFSLSTPLALDTSESSELLQTMSNDQPAHFDGKAIVLQKATAALCAEVRHFLEQVGQRDKKVFDFEKSGFALCQALDVAQKEISEFFDTEDCNVDIELIRYLRDALSVVEKEVQNLLKQAKIYTSEREMVEALWLKKEQSICTMQTALLKNVAELVGDVKIFQKADSGMLCSFSSKLKSYREKVLELEENAKELEELRRLCAEKDQKIKHLTEELKSLKTDISSLKYQLVQQAEENFKMKTDYQRTMEELQAKITKLQAVQYEEKTPSVTKYNEGMACGDHQRTINDVTRYKQKMNELLIERNELMGVLTRMRNFTEQFIIYRDEKASSKQEFPSPSCDCESEATTAQTESSIVQEFDEFAASAEDLVLEQYID